MNVVKVMGGLGNQLFQYSFGYIQRLRGKDTRYDLHWFNYPQNERYPRPCRLGYFNIDIPKMLFIRHNRKVHEKFIFDLTHLDAEHTNFDGYWQFLGYYQPYIDELRKLFWVKESHYTDDFKDLREEIINDSKSIALHVRRGDYLVQKWGIMPTSYYFAGLSLVLEKVGKGATIYIFSDDIEWCKEHFKNSYFNASLVFVGLTDYLDFELMRLCKHNVISPSTFSWWAAFLNDNPTKVVVAPSQWLGHEETGEQYPTDWIKL